MRMTTRLALGGICLVLGSTLPGYAQLSLTNGAYNKRVFRSPSGLPADSLRYQIRPPANHSLSESVALIISMHGVGPPADVPGPAFPGEGYGPVTDYDTKYRSVILEPYCPLDQTCWDNTGWGTGNHAMSTEPTHGVRMVFELIAYLKTQLHLDSSRIYLIGASNGGYATWDMILRKSELFAAAVPICGGGDSSRAGRILSMPLRIYHASADYSNPVSGSQAMAKALRKRGGNPHYYEVPPGLFWGDTHADGWAWAWRDTALLPWLYRQTRVPDSTAPSVPTGLAVQALSGGDRVRLTWNASTDAQSGPVSYFVYRNGVNIATRQDLAFTDSFLTASTSYQYEVSAFNPCDKESARNVAVSVQTLADTRAPLVEYVRTESLHSLIVRFSEKVAIASAQTVGNYQIAGVTVSAAALQFDSVTVRLTVSGVTNGQSYGLTTSNITDRAASPNTIVSGIATFVCRATGFVFEETWTGMAGGRVVDLTDSAKFTQIPTRTDTVRLLQIKPQGLQNYGSRVRGYLFPGTTGDYRFWINSDDASQLFVSTDATAGNKRLMAEVVSWLPVREYDCTSIQFSVPVRLTKDTRYYFEILYKQGGGSEHCMVAWQRLGGAAREIVPANFILPYPEVQPPTPIRGTPKRGRAFAPVLRLRTGLVPSLSIDAQHAYVIGVFDAKGACVQLIRGDQPTTYVLGNSERRLTPGVYSVRATSVGWTRNLALTVGE